MGAASRLCAHRHRATVAAALSGALTAHHMLIGQTAEQRQNRGRPAADPRQTPVIRARPPENAAGSTARALGLRHAPPIGGPARPGAQGAGKSIASDDTRGAPPPVKRSYTCGALDRGARGFARFFGQHGAAPWPPPARRPRSTGPPCAPVHVGRGATRKRAARELTEIAVLLPRAIPGGTAVGQGVRLQWRRPKEAAPAVEGLLATADEASGLLGVVRVHARGARARRRSHHGWGLPDPGKGFRHRFAAGGRGSCRRTRWPAWTVRPAACEQSVCAVPTS